ncbi:MAG: YibE/F family protein [Oscillospiraceae bacterium]|nr:YibE/F family protein [Oscillospiraceae bacterium]
MKQKIIYLLTVVLCVLLLVMGRRFATANPTVENTGIVTVAEKVKVTAVVDPEYEKTVFSEDWEMRGESIVLFEGEFMEGYKKGKRELMVQRVDDLYAVEMRPVSQGDKIAVYRNPDDQIDVNYMFAEYNRVTILWWLVAAFMFLLLLFGRGKGVSTIISLVLTVAAIFVVFVPAVLSYGNIYLWSLMTCVYIIFMTLLIVNGYTKKSLAAIIGCLGGVAVTGILVKFCDLFLHTTGLVDEDALYLMMLNPENPLDIKAVVFAAIIIGAVGAVMDVAMDISSALAEIKSQVPDISRTQIIKSGFTIGRDIIGTMSNTLILAYIGSSLSCTLLMVAGNPSLLLLFNTEMIVVELLQTIAGSFGMLLTIPLTSIVCGVLYGGNPESENKKVYRDMA